MKDEQDVVYRKEREEASSLSIASRTFRGVDMVVCLWLYGVIMTVIVIVFVID